MSSELLDLLIFPMSTAVPGLVFLGIAIWARFRYGYKGGIKSTGTLIGFRKLDNDHYFGALRYAFGIGKYEDFDINVTNSRPIIRFSVGDRIIEQHSEWPVKDLGKPDIGKNLPIRYFPLKGGKLYRVIQDSPQFERLVKRSRNLAFWIFAGIGIICFVLTALMIIAYNVIV